MTLPTPAQARKFLVAAVAALAEIANEGLVPDAYRHDVAIVLAVATALGVYGFRNAPADDADAPADEDAPTYL